MKGKVAVVTGAGRGIGRAIALALGREGARVVVSSRTLRELESAAGEIRAAGAEALAIRADVAREEDANTLIKAAVETFGTVDILVNNAGIGHFAPVAELPVSEFDAMWQVNMRGVFLCTRAALPAMMRQHSGDILNLASLAGRNAFTGGSGYAATKWALIGFSRCLMLEVRSYDIRVITLCPGSVDTTFGDHHDPRSSGSIPTADDIARTALDTLRMPRHVMVSEVDIRPTNPKK